MKKNLIKIFLYSIFSIILLISVASLVFFVKASPLLDKGIYSVPTFVSYQGQIWQGDIPYSGTGYFKFGILDSAKNIVWSNDGTPEPTTSIPLIVTEGIFSVNLGDTSFSGMISPLEPTDFDDPISYLVVWFSPDNVNWTKMPEQKISSVPFALKAQEASYAENSNLSNYAYEAGLAENSELFDGLNATSFQLRVSGTCPTGSAVTKINQNGSVECEIIPNTPRFRLGIIDESAIVGEYSSIAIGTDGFPLISYYDATNGDLKVAHCNDIYCSKTTITSYSDKWDIGQYTSLAIGNDGLGVISYFDNTNFDLYVTHCIDIACSSANIQLVDSVGVVGQHSSITIANDGYPFISYYDWTNGNLKVYDCSNYGCTSGVSRVIDSTGDVGRWTSIAIGSDTFPIISYYDVTNTNLKVAHCLDAGCTTSTTTTLDSDVNSTGEYSSITIGADGYALISYFRSPSDLRIAHCRDLACTDVMITIIDSGEFSPGGRYTSIEIGSDGLGLISYMAHTWTELKVAHCDNANCSHASIYTLDSLEYIGEHTSLAIGSDGMGIIVYTDSTMSKKLRVAHCSNEFCMPINWER